MKLTGIDILNMYESLMKIAEKEFGLNTACIIAKNIKELSISKEIVENKRNTIIMKYATKDDNGDIKMLENGNIKISNVKKFNDEMSILLSSEVDANLEKIKKDAFDGISISPKDILPLMNILEE